MRKDKLIIPKDKLEPLYIVDKISTTKIAERFRCNAETIRRRLIEYGIKRRFREIKIKIPKKELKKLYTKEKISTLELAKRYSCSQWTVRSNLLKNKIKLRTCSEFHRWKGSGNQLEPNLSDSSTLSYILGVLLGDGWLYNYKNNYFIGLDTKDYSFNKSFYDSLKMINLNPNIFGIRKGKYWRTLASSKIFYWWFRELKPRDIENVASKYPLQFLKGFYESEGCLSINHDKRYNKNYFILIMVSMDKNTMNLVKLLMERLSFHPRINLRKYKNFKPLWRLHLGIQEEIKSFIKKIKPCIKNKSKHKLYK